jgi:thioredoxin reductase (NADPH)
MHDVAIVGGGPAGLTAGIFAIRRGMKPLVLDDPGSLSQIEETNTVDDWPGIKRTSGMELVKGFKDHARSAGAEIMEEKAVDITKSGQGFKVKTEKNEYECRTLIFATGAKHRKAMVPGESEFASKGVSYCASCDAPLFRGKKVLVIGGGDSAATAAILLQSVGAEAIVVHRRDELRAAEAIQKQLEKSGAKVLWSHILKEIKGDQMVKSAVLQDVKTQKMKEVQVDGIFIAIGTVPTAELAKKIGVKLNELGFIIVDRNMRTNVPGVFAAGDCTDGPSKKLVTAAGDGGIAAESAYNYIKEKE